MKKAYNSDGHCQRAGCEKSDTILYRIEGELFAADQVRCVEAGYRLYCYDCATGIVRVTDAMGVGLDRIQVNRDTE